MYRNFNIELIDTYLDIVLEPLFINKYKEKNLETNISKINDKKQIILSKMIKYPISILNEDISLTEDEEKEYITYCVQQPTNLKIRGLW